MKYIESLFPYPLETWTPESLCLRLLISFCFCKANWCCCCCCSALSHLKLPYWAGGRLFFITREGWVKLFLACGRFACAHSQVCSISFKGTTQEKRKLFFAEPGHCSFWNNNIHILLWLSRISDKAFSQPYPEIATTLCMQSRCSTTELQLNTQKVSFWGYAFYPKRGASETTDLQMLNSQFLLDPDSLANEWSGIMGVVIE